MNKKVIIEGERVHHVGYRPFLLAKARRLKIPNYESENVKENGKERVIVSVGGDEKQLQEFVGFAKKNYPSEAKVSDVKEADSPESVMRMDEYDKQLAAEQHSTMVQTGLGMMGFQKQTIDKLDSFHQDTVQRFDNLDEKYLRISVNMERILEEMKEERKEYRTSIEKLINAILSQKSER